MFFSTESSPFEEQGLEILLHPEVTKWKSGVVVKDLLGNLLGKDQAKINRPYFGPNLTWVSKRDPRFALHCAFKPSTLYHNYHRIMAYPIKSSSSSKFWLENCFWKVFLSFCTSLGLLPSISSSNRRVFPCIINLCRFLDHVYDISKELMSQDEESEEESPKWISKYLQVDAFALLNHRVNLRLDTLLWLWTSNKHVCFEQNITTRHN